MRISIIIFKFWTIFRWKWCFVVHWILLSYTQKPLIVNIRCERSFNKLAEQKRIPFLKCIFNFNENLLKIPIELYWINIEAAMTMTTTTTVLAYNTNRDVFFVAEFHLLLLGFESTILPADSFHLKWQTRAVMQNRRAFWSYLNSSIKVR